MKEAVVDPSVKVEIVEVDIPTIKADQVLIRVVVSGSNPKDWKIPQWLKRTQNSGDDIAGFVESVGKNVTEFKKGDRVAAFHEMMSPHGSFAEYAVAWAWTTFHIPKNISFEEAATLPLAAMTACVGLYARLELPEPWKAATTTKPIPLVVYGAATAVGAFTIKLARLSNIHPIIAVASNFDFVEKLIDRSKGDTIVTYRNGDEAVVSGIKDALNGSEVFHAFDAVTEGSSYTNISKILAPGGHVTLVLDHKEPIPSTVKWSKTNVGYVHAMGLEPGTSAALGAKNFGHVFFRLLSKGLQDGWLTPHPHKVAPGGLNGIEGALADLKAGKVSAFKYVFRIEDTKSTA